MRPLSSEEKKLWSSIDPSKMPRHIAVIMDGNGRWAKRRMLPRIAGHRAAIDAVKDVVDSCIELKIDILTLFAFSTENWDRPKPEVDGLMELLANIANTDETKRYVDKVLFRAIGRLNGLPRSIRDVLAESMERTKNNGGLVLNLAVNYSGRADIVDAVRALLRDAASNRLPPVEKIDEKLFEKYLYTAGLPDPDLLIRTSGELRISNFLLWQIAYTELWITPVLWPDFRRATLLEAIVDYQKRDRRFGKVNEETSLKESRI
jgi:undecaprenyl diphosphate synthase